MSRIGYECDIQPGLAFKSDRYKENGIPILRGDNVTTGATRWQDPVYWSLTEVDLEVQQYYLRPGDIVLGMTRTCVSGGVRCALISDSDVPSLLNQRVARLASGPTLNTRYLFYLLQLRAFEDYVRSIQRDTTVPHISDTEIAHFHIPLPALPIQHGILKFLDYETLRIDALIEKQQQLIALLKEKRQAVISHAVTKGLNPDAPMRDSGVEWLGEVPAHWEVSKFGYVSSVVRGGSPRPAGDPTLFNGDYSPWVTVAEITKDDEVTLTETATFLTKKGSVQCRVFASGTLLLSNSGATLGVPKVLMIDANANDGVVGFEDLRHQREYCYYYLSSITEDLRERIKQGSGQPNLNTDIVKALAVPVPPAEEVDSIVRHIDEQRGKFKQLAEKAELGIELLQERRTALISAAVTGKIDVRGWKAPKSEMAEVVA